MARPNWVIDLNLGISANSAGLYTAAVQAISADTRPPNGPNKHFGILDQAPVFIGLVAKFLLSSAWYKSKGCRGSWARKKHSISKSLLTEFRKRYFKLWWFLSAQKDSQIIGQWKSYENCQQEKLKEKCGHRQRCLRKFYSGTRSDLMQCLVYGSDHNYDQKITSRGVFL